MTVGRHDPSGQVRTGIMKLYMLCVVIGAASVGTAIGLIWRMQRTYQELGPSPQWTKHNGRPSREFWIEETNEVSFPARDPTYPHQPPLT